ncbi:MAG: RluA family pseudouridine synthase [Planctomycetota bacterium]|nr:RluA family pseudouridine synthase [Planctomycetota bacterium]
MATAGRGVEILFEDDAVIGVVKPCGLATANARRGEPSVFTIVRQRDRRPAVFLGVVSRLDQPVSGVVVFARTPASAAALARQFRERTVGKTYLAVVEGRFPGITGEWQEWIDRLVPGEQGSGGASPVGPGSAAEGSTEARVRARVLRRAGEVSLVELAPTTGRKHQLRIQLASRRCPIVGDRRYGARLPFPDGIALHSLRLVFRHPVSTETITLAAPPPEPWLRRFPALAPFPAN